MGLRIPMTRAEKLKIEEGSTVLGNCFPGETVLLKDDSGFAGKEVERETLNTIIHMRLRETFELLKRALEEEPFLDYLGEGIFITGGCSQLNGIDNLAEDVFGIPARAAHAQTMSGLTSAFENPQFSTAIGLIKYAQAVQADRQPRSGLGRLVRKAFQRNAMNRRLLIHFVIPSRRSAARDLPSEIQCRSYVERRTSPARSLAVCAARDDKSADAPIQSNRFCLTKAQNP